MLAASFKSAVIACTSDDMGTRAGGFTDVTSAVSMPCDDSLRDVKSCHDPTPNFVLSKESQQQVLS